MFKLGKKEERNLLTMVPLLREKVRYDEGEALLIVDRSNLVERFSIRYLKQPSVRKIKLDTFGSFVIKQTLANKTVEEISQCLSEQFGEEAEPALPRLMKFLEILESQEWIRWDE